MVSRAVPTANDEPAADDLPEYPDSLDAGLLRIAGVCILASVMAILDGTVVSVASVNSFYHPDSVVMDYGAAKAALVNLTKALSQEFGPRGIRLNCTAGPGTAGEKNASATMNAISIFSIGCSGRRPRASMRSSCMKLV